MFRGKRVCRGQTARSVNRARFIAAARIEFLAEVIHYSETEAALGARFTAAVEEAAARGLAFPQSGSPFRSNTRRIFVKGFPFSLVYRTESDGGIVIFALAHHARHPLYWRSRLRGH